ncbi:hypothetical protein PJP10_32635, partial [Mycobacterium kansasii]
MPSAEVNGEILEILPVSCREVMINDWRQPFIDYLKYDILLKNAEARFQIKQKVKRFILCGEEL